MIFNQIRLLGLSIDEACDPHMRKCLEPGVLYPFFNWFKLSDTGSPEKSVSNLLPDDFFKENDTPPLVSISAIVGPNGSGKSTIVEIILRLLNNFSYKIGEALDPEHDFCIIQGLRASLYFSIGDDIYQLHQDGDMAEDILVNRYDWTEEEWMGVEADYDEGFASVEEKWKEILRDKFFYNVLLNYSIYAFNSHDFNDDRTYPDSNRRGRWIDACFHKNDGYLAPVTLNPLRTNGNINVNSEHELAKSRLISLMFLLPPEQNRPTADRERRIANPFTYINDKYSISSIRLSLDEKSVESKSERVFSDWKSRDDYSDNLKIMLEFYIVEAWNCIYAIKNEDANNDVVYQTAIKYLIYKTISVANKYNAFDAFYALSPIYRDIKDSMEWEGKIYALIEEMSKDRSHITFRLRQTLAFLKFRQYNVTDDNTKTFSVNKFSTVLKNLNAKDLDDWSLAELAPPPIFETEIYVTDKKSKSEFLLSHLSSGELQLAYSVSTVLYHLRNIDSVPDRSIRRKNYRYVNIILDEIELYFHPEYQRKYVKRLIDCFRVYPFETVRAINVMMITHSPFILSDIPRSNVLFLKDGHIVNSMQENTFAANIHSILQNGFFLENGTMGEFAREKVNQLFGQLHADRFSNDLRSNILLVSEPILRGQLLRMYNDLYWQKDAKKDLIEEIRKLSERIAALENDKNR